LALRFDNKESSEEFALRILSFQEAEEVGSSHGAASSALLSFDSDNSVNKISTTPAVAVSESADQVSSGINFSSLFPSILNNNLFQSIQCNTSIPIPFKTDLFEGVAVLIVNASEDPNAKIDISTYTFEVQVQGKFLRKPTGLLFIGAEISRRMELGLITRGICRTIMNFARSINPFIHHSFGDTEYVELPHITGPLWSLADRVVITKAGEVPPKLGQGFVEPEADRKIRRGDPAYFIEVDVTSTYSFSTNTKNIELVDWAVVNIPLLSKLGT
jgi:hypothetical protein